ncbi:hypothetical protein BJ878DRAFT_427189, partial [Calycina marina]
IGANQISRMENPLLHGEIAVINEWTAVLGLQYGLHPNEILDAWNGLTLYTTAEAYPMARPPALNLYSLLIYEVRDPTSIVRLVETVWKQISISTREVFKQSASGTEIRLVEGVQVNEADALFAWQFNEDEPHPAGCEREGGDRAVKHEKVGKSEL